jgi:multicomponent Na+:H+ antiporter subunit D
MISQLGFLVSTIGVGSHDALHAVSLVAFCSIFYQLLLFICAVNPIFMNNKLLRYICMIIGSISISALPFTSGFVSKSLLSEVVSGIPYLKNIFTIASIGIILIMGIKFPYFMIFPHKDDKKRVIRISVLVLAMINIALGVFPQYLYDLLPHNKLVYSAYNLENLTKQFSLLAIAGLLFFCLLPLFKKNITNIYDIDLILNKMIAHIKPIRFNYNMTINANYLQPMLKINPVSWGNIGLISLWSVALVLVLGFVSKYFL